MLFFFLKGDFYLQKSIGERQQRGLQIMATLTPYLKKKKRISFVYIT